MKILAISDIEVDRVANPNIARNFGDVHCIISCGDLSPAYLDYIVSLLNRPFYYVHGNHLWGLVYRDEHALPPLAGGTDLHRRLIRGPGGLLLAGMQGSLRYNDGPLQYSQAQMWHMVYQLLPRLLLNRLLYGRFLDIFVSHAPPWGIHDKEDRAHQGIHAFRWLVKTFQPALHLHGHVHIYQQYETTETQFGRTRIVNACGYKSLVLEAAAQQAR